MVQDGFIPREHATQRSGPLPRSRYLCPTSSFNTTGSETALHIHGIMGFTPSISAFGLCLGALSNVVAAQSLIPGADSLPECAVSAGPDRESV